MRSEFLLALALLGCGASSPYDRAWLAGEVKARSGHAVGDLAEGPRLPGSLKTTANLTEDGVVSTALWNSAAFQAELAQLGYARGDLEDAGALPNPSLAFLFPIGPRQLEFSLLYPIAALIHRPARVAAASMEVERTAHALVIYGLDVMRDARLAYADLVLATERLALRKAMTQTWRDLAKLAATRAKSGDTPKTEAALAEVDAVVAEDLEKRAEADVTVATARLRFAIGLADSPLGEALSITSTEPDRRTPIAEAKLLETAHAVRPDLRGAEIAVEAATQRLGWEKVRVLQFLARLDGKPIGPSGGAPIQLVPGFQVDLPIFNWNGGNKEKARADVARASFRYLALHQQVTTEIRVARVTLLQALDSLQVVKEKVLPIVEKSVAAAVRSYEEGNEPYAFVLDATRRLQDVKLRALELAADVRRARVHLDRHVGRRTDAS